jgi:hypothetical protein
MSRVRSFLGSKENRDHIAWWGGGVVLLIAALWSVFVYLFPPKSHEGGGKGGVTASHGGVSVGGNVTNSTINTNSTNSSDAQPQGY